MGVAGVAATQGAAHVVTNVHKYVQEGPAGISVLCFFGGILTMLVGIIGFLNLSQVVTGPFQYVLNAYLTFFGLITFLLEGDMESFKNLPVLGRLGPLAEPYQQIVF